MDSEKKPEYYLLIESLYSTKAKKFLYLFGTNEIVKNNQFELSLKITNKGPTHFPGGTIPEFKVVYKNVDIFDPIENISVPQIASNESTVVKIGTQYAYSEGCIYLEGKIQSNDKSPVKYYQKQIRDGSLFLIPGDHWIDFLSAVSQLEINQRYTNYILIFLTALLLIFTAMVLKLKP